jgi:phosphohistidine phosphatase
VRTVWILRHAKAGPHVPDDHGRPIVERGHRQCAELAAQLREAYTLRQFPPVALSSSAVRARQTAEEVLKGAKARTKVELEDALYEADPDDIIDRLRLLDNDFSSVIVVGHNPALSDLALLALEDDDTKGRRKVSDGLATAALAVVSFDVDKWSSVSAASGRLERLFVPKVR